MDPVVVDVAYEERYWYPDDGGVVWVVGYQPVDPQSGSYLARDAPLLAERGLVIVNVAGAALHHADVLDSDEAAPGKPLTLVRDPGNPDDSNATKVLTADGEQVGWVPRDVAVDFAPALDAGTPHAAV